MVIGPDSKMVRANSEGAQREPQGVTPAPIKISKANNNTTMNLKKMLSIKGYLRM